MLVDFSVENFLSFNKRETFSFSAGKGRNFNERIYSDGKNKLLKFAALFGANSSGKSNFVKAIAFARNYIVSEVKSASLKGYFKLNENAKELPSLFEFKIFINKNVYIYGFSVILFKNKITEEWLYDCSSKKKKIIFYRNINDSEYNIGKYFKNSELNTVLKVHAEGIKNEDSLLLLKVLNQYKNIFDNYPECTVIKDIYLWFAQKLRIIFPDEDINNYSYFMSATNMKQIVKLFDDFGFSISNYEMVNCPLDRIASQIPKDIFDDIINNINKTFENTNNRIVESFLGIGRELYLITKEENGLKCETIQFYHEDPNIPFSMTEESDGTLRILKLMEILLQKDEETIYVVDEVDRCLHALLTYNYIYRFLLKAIETNNQLIVTTHETLLLDYKLLRKDEMWFVYKKNGGSHLASLGSTKERADKKLINTYLRDKKFIPDIKENIYQEKQNN